MEFKGKTVYSTVEIKSGGKHRIHALKKNDKCEVLFLLADWKKKYKKESKILSRHLDRTAELGITRNETQFKKVRKSGIYEFKAGKLRLFCCFEGENIILLTNGLVKSGRQEQSRQIDKAERLMNEFRAYKKRC